jgi:CRP/FNR family cyclic AMP-dependent transcriptional regulator
MPTGRSGEAIPVLAFAASQDVAGDCAVPDAEAAPNPPLREDALHAIAASGVVRQFPKQTVLIHEGDAGDTLFIILSGRVKVYASNAAGREVVINFHGAGEYVGEMSLDGAPRSASVITVEPTTCAIVNRAKFRDFLAANPDFAQHLIRTLIHRARSATENLKSLALSDVYGRLVRLLNALAVDREGRLAVRERLTQQDIADRVGASRDMIGKLMKDLVGGGYLLIEDRQITILKKLPPGW